MLNYNGLGISVMGKFYSLISTFFELYQAIQGPMGLCVVVKLKDMAAKID